MPLFISMMMAMVSFLSFMVVACDVIIVFEDAVYKGLCRGVRIP